MADPRPPLADTPLPTDTVGLLAGLVSTRAIRRYRDEPVPDDRLDQGAVLIGAAAVDIAALATDVQRADAQLAGVTEPGDAVIAAWVALEHEAALQGAERRAAQTSTEFTTDLLAATPAPPEAVVTLRGLYQRARFTRRPVSAADVDAARGTPS